MLCSDVVFFFLSLSLSAKRALFKSKIFFCLFYFIFLNDAVVTHARARVF